MPPARRKVAVATLPPRDAGDRDGGVEDLCAGDPLCSLLHEAVELIGKRWSGAIIFVLLSRGPMRFSQIGNAVPELSDRLLSERMKELEARGLVERRVYPEAPVRVEYSLTEMGRELESSLRELKQWAHRWL